MRPLDNNDHGTGPDQGPGPDDGVEAIRVGLVGAGTLAMQRHVPGLLAEAGVRVVAVANRTRASAERVADAFGIPDVLEDWRQLVRRRDIDAVVVGTWPNTHRTIAVAAIEDGKHVLVGARLAATLDEALDVQGKAAQRPSQVVHVVPSGATFAYDATMRRLIRDRLGRLISVEGSFHTGRFGGPDAPLHWRQDPEMSGINHLDVGQRYESLLRWGVQATRVVALGSTQVTTRHDPRRGHAVPVRMPDAIAVTGLLAGGGGLSLAFSAGAAGTVPWRYRLVGSDAAAEVSRHGGVVLFSPGGEPSTVDVPRTERAVWTVERDFVRAIRGEHVNPPTSLDLAVRYMSFSDAVDRSLRDGGWCDIGL